MNVDNPGQPTISLSTAPDLDSSSSDDEDFKPDANPSALDAEERSSDSDTDFSSNEATTRKPKSRKRKKATEDSVELELASGDEATIRKGKRKKQRKAKGAATDGYSDEDNEDEGGEGGLIKTRAQQAKEYAPAIIHPAHLIPVHPRSTTSH
jgi:hypothetical protein